jgi:hypothetical protein
MLVIDLPGVVARLGPWRTRTAGGMLTHARRLKVSKMDNVTTSRTGPFMKSTFVVFLLIETILKSSVFADGAKAFEWGPSTNNLQMSLSLTGNQAKIEIKAPIQLLIQVKNLSTNETFTTSYTGAGGPGQGLSFIIIKKGLWNEDVSPEFPKNYDSGWAVANMYAEPGRTIHFIYDLYALQKMGFINKLDHAGTYQVIAQQTGTMGTNTVTVTSNPLELVLSKP